MPRAIFNVFEASRQWERMWEARSFRREVDLCNYRNLRRHLLTHLSQIPNPLVVEAGCGIGAWVAFLSKRSRAQVIGFDNYLPALAYLKSSLCDGQVSAADVLNMPLADNSADVVISLGVVEHFAEGPERPIREAGRILKLGGHLFITVPFYNLFRRFVIHPLRAAYMSAKSKLSGKALHFVEYRFTRREIASIVQRQGFEIQGIDVDEYECSELALGLYVDLPMFRGTRSGELSAVGRIVKSAIWAISPWLVTGGILVVARKTSAPDLQ